MFNRRKGDDDAAKSEGSEQEQIEDKEVYSHEELAKMVCRFRKGMPTSTKTHKLITYHNSFYGRDAVVWLMENFGVRRDKAKLLGRLFRLGNVFVGVSLRANDFKDEKIIYQLIDPEYEDFTFLKQLHQELNTSTVNLQALKRSEKALSNSTASLPAIDDGLKAVPKGPVKLPFFGDAAAIGYTGPQQSISQLCRKYGRCFRLSIFDTDYIVVSDPDLIEEITSRSDQFAKLVDKDPVFRALREFRGDGLTTVSDGEIHCKAQRALLPGFAKKRLQAYFPLIKQTINKRMELVKPGEKAEMRDWFARTTLGVVGKIGMGFEFNGSRVAEKLKKSIQYCAREVVDRAYVRPGHPSLYVFSNVKFKKCVKRMNTIVDMAIAQRIQENKYHKKQEDEYDMLDRMLAAGMEPCLIRYQLLTILSAGHSTTTGLLSWATYLLAQNPEEEFQLLQEIDNISGGDPNYELQFEDIGKLKFMDCVFRESLRLYPPIASVIRTSIKDGNLGPYRVKKGDSFFISILATHRDPLTWGVDPMKFNPLNFMPENVKKRSPYSFIPWIAGPRQCIGQEFALLVAKTILFTCLNQYRFLLAKNFQLAIEEHLFMRPKEVMVEPMIRQYRYNMASADLQKDKKGPQPRIQFDQLQNNEESSSGREQKLEVNGSGQETVILYGSNLGKAKEFAEELVDQAQSFHFRASIHTIDQYFESHLLNNLAKSDKDPYIIIVCATYNGLPPDNAAKFSKWLKEQNDPQLLAGKRFALFGCGNAQWFQTFQKTPILIEERMLALGAQIIHERGVGDAKEEIEDHFEEWAAQMWCSLSQLLPSGASDLNDEGEGKGKEKESQIDRKTRLEKKKTSIKLNINTVRGKSSIQEVIYDAAFIDSEVEDLISVGTVGDVTITPCTIKVNRELQSQGSSNSTRHIEIQLERGMSYRTGDHLAVCPQNPPDLVEAFATKFQVSIEGVFSLQSVSGRKGFLPVNRLLRVSNVLTNLVDLKATPTKKLLSVLSNYATSQKEERELLLLSQNTSQYEQWAKARLNVIETLDQFPSVNVPFGRALEAMQPLRPRYYSISSSPLEHSERAHLSVGVVKDDLGNGRYYLGVCSSYLASLVEGATVNVFVKASPGFETPQDNSVPIIMTAAGTGLSPFRGFLQERRARAKQSGQPAGPAALYFGCRHPNTDFIYEDELRCFQEQRILSELHVAFSRVEDNDQRMYVQHKLLATRDTFWDLLYNQRAVLYVCGSATGMARSVHETLVKIIQEKLPSCTTADQAEQYANELAEQGRYMKDVWG